MRASGYSDVRQTLKDIREQLPRLLENLGMAGRTDIGLWSRMIDHKLLPMLSPDFPLLAAICGGGSSGKSTLFNTLARESVSPTGGRAGINRRVLVAANPAWTDNRDFLSFLLEPFGTIPDPLRSPSELETPGPPLYVAAKGLPKDLMLMDTPDFDTGARGEYINRDVARLALETADVFLYIFTNSNYNNRDNTDFVAEMISGIGVRRAFLIYRVYPSFSAGEILEHAMTVAGNIYGDTAGNNILGIYRADENNAVAAGEKFMDIRPVRDSDPPLLEALKRVDATEIRRELIGSIARDAVSQAQEHLDRCRKSLAMLRLYRHALAVAQHHSVQEAVAHFPMDRILKRFTEIWLSTDPGHIQAMRKAGKIIGFPASAVIKVFRWAKQAASGQPPKPSRDNFNDKVETDLLQAVNGLYQKLAGESLSVRMSLSDPVSMQMQDLIEGLRDFQLDDGNGGAKSAPDPVKGVRTFTVSAHPAITLEQDYLKRKDWKSTLQSVLQQRETVVSLTQGIETELSALVEEFRGRMGFVEKIRQTFSAFLNVLPATAAVTYILATGDPVGAVGIKVKLSGLFGLHDLYALVAIPATTGLSQADRSQLETLLAPIAKTWLENKSKTVHDIFEKEITGPLKSRADAVIEDADRRIQMIETGLDQCRKVLHEPKGSAG